MHQGVCTPSSFPQHSVPFRPAVTANPMPTPPQTPPSLSGAFMTPLSTTFQTATAQSSEAFYHSYAEHTQSQTPQRSTLKRRRDEAHIRRPANPFILFACFYRTSHQTATKNNRELSKEAGEVWKRMSDHDKGVWRDRATAVRKKHEEDHPGYRYQPRRRETSYQHQTTPKSPKQTGNSIVFLPPTPTSMHRKSSKRTRRKSSDSRRDEASIVNSSILDSPTRQARNSNVAPRNFLEISPERHVYVPSEPPQPQATHSHLDPSADHIAGSRSAAGQPFANAYNTESSYFTPQRVNHSQQCVHIQDPRLDFEASPYQGVTPTIWNVNESLSYLSAFREDENEANLQATMAGNNDALSFGYYNQPLSEVYAGTSDIINLPSHPSIGNSSLPK